jgi:transposase
MKKINPDTQKTVVALLNQGVSVKHIASRLNIGVATVSKLRTQFLPHLKRQSSGRPGILSKTDKHTIARKMLSGELKTGKETFKYLQGAGVRISYSCVMDNLQKLGFKAKKKTKKTTLDSQTEDRALQMGQSTHKLDCGRLETCNLLRRDQNQPVELGWH